MMAAYMWMILTVAVNVVIVFTALFFFNRKMHRFVSSSNLLARVRSEVAEILTELNQTTERNIGIIENRISRLADLIQDADKRLTLLHSEQEKAEKARELHADIRSRRDVQRADRHEENAQSQPVSSGMPPGKAPARQEERQKVNPPTAGTQKRLFRSDEAAFRVGTGIERYGKTAGITPAQERPKILSDGMTDSAQAGSPGKKKQEVLDLYRQGFDAKMIAARTGKALGEVELIISLEKGKG